jgi:hypothetical protein
VRARETREGWPLLTAETFFLTFISPKGGPTFIILLRQMGTHEVLYIYMKGVLPWLVRWACRFSIRNFCPALAALVGPVQNMLFLSPHTISLHLSPIARASWTQWTGSRAASRVY